MSKEFLFCYPIEEYINVPIDWWCKPWQLFRKKGGKIKQFDNLIDKRYRKNGWKINWLMFSDEKDESKPDMSRTSKYFKTHKEDRILVAGMGFDKHIKTEKYPDENFILEQIPIPDKLIIGGFHATSCINKLAAAAYKKGIDVWVDEDVTELFFTTTGLLGVIPIKRKKSRMKELLELGTLTPATVEFMKRDRKKKPWFEQV